MRARRAEHLSAIFLDRDGIINRKAPEGRYVTSLADFDFLPSALEGLRVLAGIGVPIVVVTNQRGIARGAMAEADLAEIHAHMSARVREAGGRMDAIYHCPHEGGCDCRKPGVGMFRAAADDLDISLRRSAMVGDRASDMEAAATVGALRVLVGSPPERISPVDYRAADLVTAARWLAGQGLRASAMSE